MKKYTYTSPSEYLKKPQKPRTVRLKVMKSKPKAGYKIPKTPRTSGYGWGG